MKIYLQKCVQVYTLHSGNNNKAPHSHKAASQASNFSTFEASIRTGNRIHFLHIFQFCTEISFLLFNKALLFHWSFLNYREQDTKTNWNFSNRNMSSTIFVHMKMYKWNYGILIQFFLKEWEVLFMPWTLLIHFLQSKSEPRDIKGCISFW